MKKKYHIPPALVKAVKEHIAAVKLAERKSKGEPRPGEVWRIKPVSDDISTVLVLKRLKEPGISGGVYYHVVPVLPYPALASREDYIFPASNKFLRGAIAAFWNSGFLLNDKFSYRLCTLTEKQRKECEKVWQFADGLPVKGLDRLPIGRPITINTDYRLRFREEIKAETIPLWEPALAEVRRIHEADSAPSKAPDPSKPRILKIPTRVRTAWKKFCERVLKEPAPEPIPAFGASTPTLLSTVRALETETRNIWQATLFSEEKFEAWFTFAPDEGLYFRYLDKERLPVLDAFELRGPQLNLALSRASITLHDGECVFPLLLQSTILREAFTILIIREGEKYQQTFTVK